MATTHTLKVNTYLVDQIADPIDRAILRKIWLVASTAFEPELRASAMDIKETETRYHILCDYPISSVISHNRINLTFASDYKNIDNILTYYQEGGLRVEVIVFKSTFDITKTEETIVIMINRANVLEKRGIRTTYNKGEPMKRSKEEPEREKDE